MEYGFSYPASFGKISPSLSRLFAANASLWDVHFTGDFAKVNPGYVAVRICSQVSLVIFATHALRSRGGNRPTLDASPNENRVIFLSPLSKSAVQISLKKCGKSLDIFLRF